MDTFVRVGAVADFVEGRGRAVTLDGCRIAVLREGGRFVALADACPHMGASLADGRLEQGVVTCPWHGWRYDALDGRGLPPARPWACVRVFDVKVEGDDVLVRRPQAKATIEESEDDATYWDAERWFRKPQE